MIADFAGQMVQFGRLKVVEVVALFCQLVWIEKESYCYSSVSLREAPTKMFLKNTIRKTN